MTVPGSEQRGLAGESALDPDQVKELAVFTTEELKAVVQEVIGSVSAAIAAVRTAAAGGDMDSLARAAHTGRNEALVVGARELADAFEQAESAARAGEAEATQEAIGRVQTSWFSARAAVERLLDPA